METTASRWTVAIALCILALYVSRASLGTRRFGTLWSTPELGGLVVEGDHEVSWFIPGAAAQSIIEPLLGNAEDVMKVSRLEAALLPFAETDLNESRSDVSLEERTGHDQARLVPRSTRRFKSSRQQALGTHYSFDDEGEEEDEDVEDQQIRRNARQSSTSRGQGDSMFGPMGPGLEMGPGPSMGPDPSMGPGPAMGPGSSTGPPWIDPKVFNPEQPPSSNHKDLVNQLPNQKQNQQSAESTSGEKNNSQRPHEDLDSLTNRRATGPSKEMNQVTNKLTDKSHDSKGTKPSEEEKNNDGKNTAPVGGKSLLDDPSIRNPKGAGEGLEQPGGAKTTKTTNSGNPHDDTGTTGPTVHDDPGLKNPHGGGSAVEAPGGGTAPGGETPNGKPRKDPGTVTTVREDTSGNPGVWYGSTAPGYYMNPKKPSTKPEYGNPNSGNPGSYGAPGYTTKQNPNPNGQPGKTKPGIGTGTTHSEPGGGGNPAQPGSMDPWTRFTKGFENPRLNPGKMKPGPSTPPDVTNVLQNIAKTIALTNALNNIQQVTNIFKKLKQPGKRQPNLEDPTEVPKHTLKLPRPNPGIGTPSSGPMMPKNNVDQTLQTVAKQLAVMNAMKSVGEVTKLLRKIERINLRKKRKTQPNPEEPSPGSMMPPGALRPKRRPNLEDPSEVSKNIFRLPRPNPGIGTRNPGSMMLSGWQNLATQLAVMNAQKNIQDAAKKLEVMNALNNVASVLKRMETNRRRTRHTPKTVFVNSKKVYVPRTIRDIFKLFKLKSPGKTLNPQQPSLLRHFRPGFFRVPRTDPGEAIKLQFKNRPNGGDIMRQGPRGPPQAMLNALQNMARTVAVMKNLQRLKQTVTTLTSVARLNNFLTAFKKFKKSLPQQPRFKTRFNPKFLPPQWRQPSYFPNRHSTRCAEYLVRGFSTANLFLARDRGFMFRDTPQGRLPQRYRDKSPLPSVVSVDGSSTPCGEYLVQGFSKANR
ncbi:hypothetical protein HDU96_005020 [Phlyctochytrium bullatum]|nr:hypothetical protein HDU96_005020 [Phlyctochytrium bullatum]